MDQTDSLKINSLGESWPLGALYDEQNNKFLKLNINSFTEQPLNFNTETINNKVIRPVDFSNRSSPFEALGVNENNYSKNNPVPGNSTNIEQYHRFLKGESDYPQSTKKTGIFYSRQRKLDHFDTKGIQIKSSLRSELLKTKATHFIKSVINGNDLFIILACQNISNSEMERLANRLNQTTNDLLCILHESPENEYESDAYSWDEQLVIDVFGTTLLPVRFPVTSFHEATKNITRKTNQFNDMYPLVYVMFDLRQILDFSEVLPRTIYERKEKFNRGLAVSKEFPFAASLIDFVKMTRTPEEGHWDVKDYSPLFMSCPKALGKETASSQMTKTSCRPEQRKWTCFHCNQTVMCGIDGFLYCSCGRIKPSILPSTHAFKCHDSHHGSNYSYLNDLGDIQAIVDRLNQKCATKEYINFLLIGQRGVGKTTFINALANYLAFNTFQEAEKTEPKYPVPAKFTFVDEAFNSGTIYFGDGQNENLEDSFKIETTKSYTFSWGEKIVRIINAPSLEDTSTNDQNRVVTDIAKIVTHYGQIHSICFFLMENYSSSMDCFKSFFLKIMKCFNKGINKNIIFTFTNAMSNFFRPGETFDILKSILSEISQSDPEFKIELTSSRYYCLDNEAFKYLVLKHQKACLDIEANRERCEQSWERSSNEIKNMIQYVCSLPPYESEKDGIAGQLMSILKKPLATATSEIQIEILKLENELLNLTRKPKEENKELDPLAIPQVAKEIEKAEQELCLVKDAQISINRIRAVLMVHVGKQSANNDFDQTNEEIREIIDEYIKDLQLNSANQKDLRRSLIATEDNFLFQTSLQGNSQGTASSSLELMNYIVESLIDIKHYGPQIINEVEKEVEALLKGITISSDVEMSVASPNNLNSTHVNKQKNMSPSLMEYVTNIDCIGQDVDQVKQCCDKISSKDSETKTISETKMKEINILLLGETGVGKSTFINSLANYLAFANPDAAINSPELLYLISSSFIFMSDDNNPIKVTLGSDPNEQGASDGQSSTQCCRSYVFKMKGYVLRLIDTPGIGDTRGIFQDKENMTNILSFVSHYSYLHGVAILLKPNHSRLTPSFRFCLTEILYHLHHTACENIVFLFTNSRVTSYRLGDTVEPLKALLEETRKRRQDLNLTLTSDRTYYVDSEGFRYVVFKKNGIDFDQDDVNDYTRSWKTSADACGRFLKYVSSLNIHRVKDTLSLNDAQGMLSVISQFKSYAPCEAKESANNAGEEAALPVEKGDGNSTNNQPKARVSEEEMEYERAEIGRIETKLVRYLKSNSIFAYNTGSLDYLDYLIQLEKYNMDSDSQLNQLQELRKRFENERNAMENEKGSVDEWNDATIEDIKADISLLYKLPHHGPLIKKEYADLEAKTRRKLTNIHEVSVDTSDYKGIIETVFGF